MEKPEAVAASGFCVESLLRVILVVLVVLLPRGGAQQEAGKQRQDQDAGPDEGSQHWVCTVDGLNGDKDAGCDHQQEEHQDSLEPAEHGSPRSV